MRLLSSIRDVFEARAEREDLREEEHARIPTTDLLAAVRLPNVAWKAGGTDALADILVLRRRRPGEEPVDDAWLDASKAPGSTPAGLRPVNGLVFPGSASSTRPAASAAVDWRTSA